MKIMTTRILKMTFNCPLVQWPTAATTKAKTHNKIKKTHNKIKILQQNKKLTSNRHDA